MVCRVIKANDGGAGGGRNISMSKKSLDFRENDVREENDLGDTRIIAQSQPDCFEFTRFIPDEIELKFIRFCWIPRRGRKGIRKERGRVPRTEIVVAFVGSPLGGIKLGRGEVWVGRSPRPSASRADVDQPMRRNEPVLKKLASRVSNRSRRVHI